MNKIDMETARQARVLLLWLPLAALGDEDAKAVLANMGADGLTVEEIKRASLPGVDLGGGVNDD